MSQWQPIETAPIRKEVLLYCTPIYGEAFLSSGYLSGDCDRDGFPFIFLNDGTVRASHWMPLPEPPIGENK